ncbi:PEBP-like protein [Auriscalpium vulgare]|uniref:PEBP-like protein n=1 Tax=Auriscalpium vulgare TaxID=40419 RepID=A0ACB8RIQ5_9AGAM|nr:PEBP-like protein [Auriscalpium vulgare]
MLSLRRLPRLQPGSLSRANATVAPAASADAPAAASPPPPKPEAANAAPETPSASPEKASARGRRRWPTHRPSITIERPREWRRPVAPGVIPAYDEALRLLQWDSHAVQTEANELRERLDKENVAEDEATALREKLDVLDVMSKVNLPDVRWKAANGMADMNQTVYRHLVEQRWREEGSLSLLMERIHQMKVIPDVVPDLHPSLDLRLNFPEPPPEDPFKRSRIKRKYLPVEPGVYLLNEQTRRPPRIYTTVFHTEPRLYTLLMIDADVPDVENGSFTTFLHWLHPNITLSANTPFPLPAPNTYTPYIPPHPARGTPYHRYVLLLLPHASPNAVISPGPIERQGFDVRKFVEEHNLQLGTFKEGGGGGAHMWRAVWDEESSRIWRDVLKQPEPKFGFEPKHNPYAEFKGRKKYI